MFLTLQKLKKEEQARIGAVREEKEQKSQTMKRRSEDLSRDTAALSELEKQSRCCELKISLCCRA